MSDSDANKKPTRVHCRTCVWWEELQDEGLDRGKQQGDCRRFPPISTPRFLNSTYEEESEMSLSDKRRFSRVWDDDYCGEYLGSDGHSLRKMVESRKMAYPS